MFICYIIKNLKKLTIAVPTLDITFPLESTAEHPVKTFKLNYLKAEDITLLTFFMKYGTLLINVYVVLIPICESLSTRYLPSSKGGLSAIKRLNFMPCS